MRAESYRIRAVFFDFDGTLTRPGALDFPAIREAIGCPPGAPILEFVAALPDPADRAARMAVVDGIEYDAASASVPADGAAEVVGALRRAGVLVGIVSRNGLRGIERALENFPDLGTEDFDVVVSRDIPVRPKPAPDGVLHAAQALGLDTADVLMVGDHRLDIEAGAAAGALTALLPPQASTLDDVDGPLPAGGDPGMPDLPWSGGSIEPDFVFARLADVLPVVRMGRPLPLGKFPNDLLSEYLQDAVDDDPALLVKPAVGEDVAAVDVSGDDILVLKSDPITFVTEALGEYLVVINANDIATSGATPRWLLAAALFPAGTTPSAVIQTLADLSAACRRRSITLCGGHTEITDAVTRPVVVGTMAGTVERADLIDKRAMRPGDRVLLTKGVAVEGTAILASEAGDRLEELGMTPTEVAKSRRFLERLAILEEAAIARAEGGVTAMHDVTEGGLATAVRELAAAGGHGIRVDLESIPVIPQTARICELLGLDPLGLIGSGSLLICCRDDAHEALAAAIRAAGIEVSRIGTVLPAGGCVEAFREGRPAAWPAFEVDELARYFQERMAATGDPAADPS